LADWAVFDDGAFVAYGVQKSGIDWPTIRVIDVNRDKALEDAVEWARFSLIWRVAEIPAIDKFYDCNSRDVLTWLEIRW